MVANGLAKLSYVGHGLAVDSNNNIAVSELRFSSGAIWINTVDHHTLCLEVCAGIGWQPTERHSNIGLDWRRGSLKVHNGSKTRSLSLRLGEQGEKMLILSDQLLHLVLTIIPFDACALCFLNLFSELMNLVPKRNKSWFSRRNLASSSCCLWSRSGFGALVSEGYSCTGANLVTA